MDVTGVTATALRTVVGVTAVTAGARRTGSSCDQQPRPQWALLQEITMTAALSTHQAQSPTHSETISRSDGLRPAARSVNFELERSRGSRHRHRVLISTQHLAALFDSHSDRSPSLH